VISSSFREHAPRDATLNVLATPLVQRIAYHLMIDTWSEQISDGMASNTIIAYCT